MQIVNIIQVFILEIKYWRLFLNENIKNIIYFQRILDR